MEKAKGVKAEAARLLGIKHYRTLDAHEEKRRRFMDNMPNADDQADRRSRFSDKAVSR